MIALMSGMVTMGLLVAAMFFLRFWKRTKDMLFLAFAVAFVLLALNQGLVGVSAVGTEDRSLLYIPRLIAFALIIAAIVWKNTAGTRSAKP